jgi:hypothetical protein
MSSKFISRRDFLKIASLSAFGLAAARSAKTTLALEAIHGGKVSFRPIGPIQENVLSPEQKNRLQIASRHFIALEEDEANQVALEIDFIEGFNEHASTMCGPLSISILQRAELLGAWVEPRDFWLLNPREDLRSAANAFPSDLYDWHHFQSPISSFNFAHFPLQAGDLLYLHAGPSDTFEHILVVNRVDKLGRAYSVTNFFTESGTVINERMLYDPSKPGEGQFHAWADRKYRGSTGITGSGGFRVWRVKDGQNLEFPNDAASRILREALNETLRNGGGAWFATISAIDGPKLFQFNPYESFHPASTIKVAVAMAFYAWLDRRQEEDFSDYLNSKGTGGRSYAQLLEGMIVESEEEATESLVNFLGEKQIDGILASWGFDGIRISPRRSSAGEISQLLEGLYSGMWLSSQSRAHLLGLMATYTESDDTRIGLIRDQLPSGASIFNKRGSLVPAPRVVADSGIIDLPAEAGLSQRAFTYSIHGLGTDGSSYEALEAKLDQAVRDFGIFLSSS